MKETRRICRAPLVALLSIALAAAACGGGGNNPGDSSTDGDVELPETFTLKVELVPAEGYKPEDDVDYMTVTLHTDPPRVFENVQVPGAPPYTVSFEMEPADVLLDAAVTVDAFRRGSAAGVFAAARCPAVRLGDFRPDPSTGEERPLRVFVQKLETFGLMPAPAALEQGRTSHRAAVAPSGALVVVGGDTARGMTNVVEVFDAGRMAFRQGAAQLPGTRSDFALAPAGEGTWVLVGGRTLQSAAHVMTAAAGGEPAFSTLSLPAELQGVYGSPRTALLADGSVLVGGAHNAEGTYHPACARVTPGSPPALALFPTKWGEDTVEIDKYHPSLTRYATPAGERVLVYGGGGVLSSAFILDPATGQVTDAEQAASDSRADHGAVRVVMKDETSGAENDAVLIMGGGEKLPDDTYELAKVLWVFVPACLEGSCIAPGAWSNGGPVFENYPAMDGTAALLPDGRALYIGGRDAEGKPVSSVTVVDATSLQGFRVQHFKLAVARVAPAVAWSDVTRQLFIVGGEGESGEKLASVEVFTPKED